MRYEQKHLIFFLCRRGETLQQLKILFGSFCLFLSVSLFFLGLLVCHAELAEKERKQDGFVRRRGKLWQQGEVGCPSSSTFPPSFYCLFFHFFSLFLSPTLFFFPHFSEVAHACCLRFRLKYYAFHSHPCFYHHKSRFSYTHNMQQLCLVSFSSEMYEPFLNYTNACKQHSCCLK